MKAELALEKQFCHANPFMLEVWQRLIALGKKPTVVSDMYLPSDFLREVLDENGFVGYEKVLVSCEEVLSKSDGRIYQKLKEDGFGKKSWIHVGDNLHSDGKMAESAGVAAHLYPNADHAGKRYRAYDMSPVIGGAYRGIVNHALYNGSQAYSMEYEYGFVYGGLFAVGYCQFIHEYCRQNGIDRVLFLSRDGDILEKVYRKLYPEEDTAYVYWSRMAGMKLMAAYDKNDYFRRFIDHKANQGKTIGQILTDMELAEKEGESLAGLLDELHGKHQVAITSDDLLTDKNAKELKGFLQAHFDQVIVTYQNQMSAAKKYYAEKLSGCKKAVAVDIGWAGSGAMAISYLAERVWKIPCEITGIIAGTNTVHNAEPEASEMFLQTGKLVSYLYSQADNRDLLKKHDPAKGYNVFWELLLASPTRQFCGFYPADQIPSVDAQDLEPSDVDGVALRFGDSDPNQEGMREVQQGILDFTELWMRHFKDYPYMFHISGRDAYAPLLAAAGNNEKYLNVIRKKFDLKEDIN